MANEIAIALGISVDAFSNVLPTSLQFGPLSVDIAGATIVSSGTQIIGTSAEALALNADHTTPGWVLLFNTDATNYVAIGEDADASFQELLAGEACLFRLSRAAAGIELKANTANVLVRYFVIEA
jgi:hypothetical protein